MDDTYDIVIAPRLPGQTAATIAPHDGECKVASHMCFRKWALGGDPELTVFVHGPGANPRRVVVALTDTLRDVVLRIADAVLLRGGAQWGLQ